MMEKSILVSNISFHGKLLGAASFTKSPELHFDFPNSDVEIFEYGVLDSLKTKIENSPDKFLQF